MEASDTNTRFSNACEYPIAFQSFPVIQYLANSVATQTNGTARNANAPNRRRSTDVIAANIPGNIPTTAVTQNSKKYASGHGKPA